MPNKTYVFNQVTLDQAIDVWIAQESIKQPQNKEALSILKVAIPWFMKHLNQTNSVYMFSERLLIDELEEWKTNQLTSFPHQRSRIEQTCKLLFDFFQSELVLEYKMLLVA